jgi:hypothetical protein
VGTHARPGTVSGVQASVQSLCEIASFVAGSILSRPQQFPALMAGSCCAVASAGGLYLAYVVRGRLRDGDGGGGRGGGGGGGCGAAPGAQYSRLVEEVEVGPMGTATAAARVGGSSEEG